MSNKTTTDTANSYNSGAMSNYNSFQGQLGNILPSLASNPLNSSYFNQQLSQSMGAANQIGQRNMSNSLSNLQTGGGLLSNAPGYTQSLVQKNMLANSSMDSSAFNSSLSSALNTRNYALQAMQGYSPLQTGQNTSQQQTQGWGSIAGSLAGVGLSAAMPGISSMLGGASFSDGYGS
jgi:hypothetical protein